MESAPRTVLPTIGGAPQGENAQEPSGGNPKSQQNGPFGPQSGPGLHSGLLPSGTHSGRAQVLHSARATVGDKGDQLRKEEETVRAVYKKHAQSFFEEIKQEFLRETAALKKQAQKALAKVSAPLDVDLASEPIVTVASIQAQLAALRRQVSDLQPRTAASAATAAGPCSRQSQKASIAGLASSETKVAVHNAFHAEARDPNVPALAERVTRVQEEVGALMRHVRSEATAAKKAALIPMWKERALQEIAQGELRAVCAEEVNRAFRDFTSCSLDESLFAPMVLRMCEGEAAASESRLRAELRGLSADLSRRLEEVEATAAGAAEKVGAISTALGERIGGLEVAQRASDTASLHLSLSKMAARLEEERVARNSFSKQVAEVVAAQRLLREEEVST